MGDASFPRLVMAPRNLSVSPDTRELQMRETFDEMFPCSKGSSIS
jgi:hypothetical protein